MTNYNLTDDCVPLLFKCEMYEINSLNKLFAGNFVDMSYWRVLDLISNNKYLFLLSIYLPFQAYIC